MPTPLWPLCAQALGQASEAKGFALWVLCGHTGPRGLNKPLAIHGVGLLAKPILKQPCLHPPLALLLFCWQMASPLRLLMCHVPQAKRRLCASQKWLQVVVSWCQFIMSVRASH